MARLIKANGTEEVVTPAGKKWTLEEIQKQVGGYFEYAPHSRYRVIVNEEGRLRNQLPNMRATQEYRKISGVSIVLVGDVLILDKGEKA